MSVPNPTQPEDVKTHTESAATAASGVASPTPATGVNNTVTASAELSQPAYAAYKQSLANLASVLSLQAKPDQSLKITDKTGQALLQSIEAAPNYCSVNASLITQIEIRQKQKDGVFIYKLQSSKEKTTYAYLEFSKAAVEANDFRLSTKPEVYHLEVTDKRTAILTSYVDLITDKPGVKNCANSQLAFGSAGELKIVTSPTTTDELQMSFDATNENRCTIS